MHKMSAAEQVSSLQVSQRRRRVAAIIGSIVADAAGEDR